jgi:hypothetical protein
LTNEFWCSGFSPFLSDIKIMSGESQSKYSMICWCYQVKLTDLCLHNWRTAVQINVKSERIQKVARLSNRRTLAIQRTQYYVLVELCSMAKSTLPIPGHASNIRVLCDREPRFVIIESRIRPRSRP